VTATGRVQTCSPLGQPPRGRARCLFFTVLLPMPAARPVGIADHHRTLIDRRATWRWAMRLIDVIRNWALGVPHRLLSFASDTSHHPPHWTEEGYCLNGGIGLVEVRRSQTMSNTIGVTAAVKVPVEPAIDEQHVGDHPGARWRNCVRSSFATAVARDYRCARIHARTHYEGRVDPRVNQERERRRTRGEKVIRCFLLSRNHHH
jgi:hypothetical protein